MSLFDLRCWDGNGQLTFTTTMQPIRTTSYQVILSGEAGSIALSELRSGLAGVRFRPVYPETSHVSPYTRVSGDRLHWSGSVGDFYLEVTDIVDMDSGTQEDPGHE